MKMTRVDELPEKRRARKDLQAFIEQFVYGDDDIVKIEFEPNEYSSPKTCYSCLKKAIKTSGYQSIKVYLRGGNVYLTKQK